MIIATGTPESLIRWGPILRKGWDKREKVLD